MTARIISVLALVAVVAVQVDSYACATKGGQSYYSQGSFKGQPATQLHQSSQQVQTHQVKTQHYQAPLTSYAPAKGHYQPTYQAPVFGSKGGFQSFSAQHGQKLELPAQPVAQLELPAQTVQQPAVAPTEVVARPEQRIETVQPVVAAPAQVEAQLAPVQQPVASEQRVEPVLTTAPSKGFFGQTLQRPEVVLQQPVNTPAQVEAAPAVPLASTPKL